MRGNGKIIQELEGEFRGAGWNVIKLLWGSYWDPLLARDKEGILRKIMMETVDGDYQAMKANDGAFVRKNFFGRHPKLLEMVAKMSDDDIWRLHRGGHDPQKVYAAFHRASQPQGPADRAADQDRQGLRHGQERRRQEHRAPDQEADRRRHPRIPRPLQHPDPGRQAGRDPVLQAGRRHAGDEVPARAPQGAGRLPAASAAPRPTSSSRCRRSTPSRPCSSPPPKAARSRTTQAYVRFLTQLLRDKELGPRVVPILVDEARTFGMEGLFRQIGIYNPEGQKYTPVDKDQVMYYREDKAGQILQEGINEAGGMSQLDRRGDVVLDEQPHHDPVLHLLLDVRLAARRRPGLGGRRHAGARLPAGRHLRAHHAQRRRPAARGRPQPHPGRHDPQLRELRPDLRARGRRDHAPRPEAHGGEAGERLLLHHAAERELPDARPASPAPKSRSSRACTCCKEGAKARRRASTCSARGTILRESMAAQGAAREGLGRGRQRVELPELQRAGARRPGLRALEPAAPDREAARAVRDAAARRSTPARWWRRPTT